MKDDRKAGMTRMRKGGFREKRPENRGHKSRNIRNNTGSNRFAEEIKNVTQAGGSY